MKVQTLIIISVFAFRSGALQAADRLTASIGNGVIEARLHLPDAKNGYYRGTRFDWSGVIHSLVYKGHEYYGEWFDKKDPKVRDFVYEGSRIIVGACSGITGPVDEFRQPLGFDTAAAGGNFVKVGIGALRKPDDGKYDNYRLYDVADGGKWTVRPLRDSVEFTQELIDASSGYGYVYRKLVRLTKGKPEMVLSHSLRNTGKKVIETTVYNHNFLTLDKQAPGPGLVVTVPFKIQTGRPPNPKLAEIRGNELVYLKTLENRDVVTFPLQGFSENVSDHEIRVENRKLGAGVRIRADRPLSSEFLWSIRTVSSVEPYIAIHIEPGKEFTWTSTYDYYTLPTIAEPGGPPAGAGR